MEQWNQIFTAVILPLLTALMGLLIAWLNAKRVELGAKIKDSTAKKYYDLATTAVLQAVQHTTQTYVDNLKSTGAFSKDAQVEAFERSKLLATAMISQSAKEIISEAYGDFDAWLATQIETTVRSTKQ